MGETRGPSASARRRLRRRARISRVSPPCTRRASASLARAWAALRDRRRRPVGAAILAAAARTALERAGGVDGNDPRRPDAFRGVVVEVSDATRGDSPRGCLAPLGLRDAFATAAIGALVARRHEGAAADLRRLTHALASADWDAFFDRVAPAAAAEARNLTNEQRAAILALVPRSCADEPSLGRALERFARDAKLYARVNGTALE